LEKLAPYFPGLTPEWTARAPLPGSDFGREPRERARDEFFARHPQVPRETLRGIFRRHGSRAAEVAGDGRLGEDFGAGLTERELRYLAEHEWARTAEDVLWRRTKAGLHMSAEQRARVASYLGRA
jgi:glycerol-3-phosphate dehydrogenase